MPKLIFFVTLSNILSFAAPYLITYLFSDQTRFYSFEQSLEHLPFYTVGFLYLFVTVAVELPVMYYAFSKSGIGKLRLFLTILCANVLTTALTAIVKRTICYGAW